MSLSRPIVYVFGFGTARGALFFAPIVLANILSLESYGTIERAQAIAVLLALIIGLGLPASAPLILLRREVTARWDTLLLMVIVLSGLAFTVTAVAFLTLGKGLSLGVLIPVTVGLLLLQSMWSAALKARGRANTALFLETGFWLSAVIGAAFSLFFAISNDWIALVFLSYGLLLWAAAVQAFRCQRAPFGLADLRDNIKLGAPLLVATLFTLLVTSSGRYILAITSNAETVGIFSVLFRATALPLVGHQMLTVAFFRQLYTWDIQTLRRRSPLIPIGVFIFVIGFWILADPLGWMLGKRFQDIFAQYRFIGLLILSQTIFWSAIALNDMLNARLQIAAYVARLTLPFLLTGLILLSGTMITFGSVNLQLALFVIVVGQSLLMAIFYLAQCAGMYLKGHAFWRLWLTVGGSFGAVAVAIIIQMAQ